MQAVDVANVAEAVASRKATWSELDLVSASCWPDPGAGSAGGPPGLADVVALIESSHDPTPTSPEYARVLRRMLAHLRLEDPDKAATIASVWLLPGHSGLIEPDWTRVVALTALAHSGNLEHRFVALQAALFAWPAGPIERRWHGQVVRELGEALDDFVSDFRGKDWLWLLKLRSALVARLAELDGFDCGLARSFHQKMNMARQELTPSTGGRY